MCLFDFYIFLLTNKHPLTLLFIPTGTLKPRDNPRMLGTDKEHMLLNPEEAWYKNNAVDFSRLQVSGLMGALVNGLICGWVHWLMG